MLAPDGRAVLVDALRPPVGYTLSFAVACTFTVDLTAALVVPLAFARSQLGDSRDPIAVMEAVRASTDRVAIFCQAGNMSAPPVANELLEFVEPMIHEVRRPRPGRLFHPKVWALCFDAENEIPRYRVLVLSRNLTFERGWDAVLRLDDIPGVTRRNRDNDQLARFLTSLPGMTTSPLSDERVEKITELADGLRRVTWERPDGVDEIRFWSFGLGRTPRPDMNGYRHLVISPFVSDGGLTQFLGSPDLTVVSRTDQLDRLDPELLREAKIYEFEPMIGYGGHDEGQSLAFTSAPDDQTDGTPTLSSGDDVGLRDLHAKVYLVERARRAHVFVGSANATDAAFQGNVELLCELQGRPANLGVGSVLDEDVGIAPLLQRYEPKLTDIDDELERLKWRLEELLRTAAELLYRAEVKPSGDQWTVSLGSSGPLPPGAVGYTIAPLNRPVERRSVAADTRIAVDFGPRSAADLTAFYLLTARLQDDRVDARSTVVHAELVGAPVSRFDEIIARQVDTPEKFLRFLLLLLGAATDFSTGLGLGTGEWHSGGTSWLVGASGVFELLVTSLASRPQALDEVASLVGRLSRTDSGRAVLPGGWEEVWTAVVEAGRRLEIYGTLRS